MFFDGVPDPSSVVTQFNDSLCKADTIFSSEKTNKNQKYFAHLPYKENECGSCHDMVNKRGIIKPQPELCYDCHEDFSNKLKSVHGPVAAGYCTACHNPHISSEPKLLLRSCQQICLYCHSYESVMKNDVHKEIGDNNCTTCHNPHGGDDKYNLK